MVTPHPSEHACTEIHTPLSSIVMLSADTLPRTAQTHPTFTFLCRMPSWWLRAWGGGFRNFLGEEGCLSVSSVRALNGSGWLKSWGYLL